MRKLAPVLTSLLVLAAVVAWSYPSVIRPGNATEIDEYPLPGVPATAPVPLTLTIVQADPGCPRQSTQPTPRGGFSAGIYFVENSGSSNKIGRLCARTDQLPAFSTFSAGVTVITTITTTLATTTSTTTSTFTGCGAATSATCNGTLVFFEWPIPSGSATPTAIADAPDCSTSSAGCRIAFTEPGAGRVGILTITPCSPTAVCSSTTANSIKEFVLPFASGSPSPSSSPFQPAVTWVDTIRLAITSTGSNQIVILDTSTNFFTVFNVPTPGAGLAKVVATDNNILWFAENTANNLGKFSISAQRFTEYSIPGGNGPTDVQVDSNGIIWIAATNSGKIFSFNPATEVFASYSMPSLAGAQVTGLAIDSKGQIWFTERAGNNIGKLDAVNGFFSEYPIIAAAAQPTGIRYEAASNALWFTESNVNKLGRLVAPGPILTPTTVTTATFTGGSFSPTTVTTTTTLSTFPGPFGSVTGGTFTFASVQTAIGARSTTLVTSSTTSLAGVPPSLTTQTAVTPASTRASTTTSTVFVDVSQLLVTSSTTTAGSTTNFFSTNVTTTQFSTSFTSQTATTTSTSTSTTFRTTTTTATSVTTQNIATAPFSNISIPGFSPESLAAGFALSLALLLIRRRRRAS